MLRHLPPTATPLPLHVLTAAARPRRDATEHFRTAFTAYAQTNASYVASSGRTALYLLLRALMPGADPQRTGVILPAYTCPSLGKVVLDAGLQPCWVDIDPATLDFVSDGLAEAVDERTLAVVCVHPFGIPHDVTEAMKLAREAGAVVIEDVAQSMGARVGKRLAGTTADYGLFSLGPGKPLSAGGGGIVTANHEAAATVLAARWQRLDTPSAAESVVAALRLAAFTAAFHPLGWWFATRAGAQKAGDSEAGWGFSLTDLTNVQAQVALTQLPHLVQYNETRRRNAELILDGIQQIDGLTIPASTVLPFQAAHPIYLRLPLLAESEERCDALYDRLWSAGIGVGRMYRKTMPECFPGSLPTVPHAGTYPGAVRVARTLLTLPTHHYVSGTDIQRIVDIFTTGVR